MPPNCLTVARRASMGTEPCAPPDRSQNRAWAAANSGHHHHWETEENMLVFLIHS